MNHFKCYFSGFLGMAGKICKQNVNKIQDSISENFLVWLVGRRVVALKDNVMFWLVKVLAYCFLLRLIYPAVATIPPTITPTAYPTLSPHSVNIISSIAGTGGAGNYSGDGGQATSATLNFPTGIVVDASGIIIIIIMMILFVFMIIP